MDREALESSAIAGEEERKDWGEEGVGLRTGDEHEIFVTSQVGSLSGSGSRSGPGPGVAQLEQTRAR